MRIRELQFDDFRAVREVRRRNGLRVIAEDEWEHLLRRNPFASADPPVAHGWILENDRGEVVGTYGNYPAGYEWNGRPLLAGIAHTWAVDADYRRHSLGLFLSYLKQRNVHFLLNASATRDAARVQEVMKTARVPVHYFDDILLWILNYRGFVEGALRYKSLPLASIAKFPLAAGLWCRDRFRSVRMPDSTASVRKLREFDERFDGFWEKLRAIPGKLRAVRTRESLAWHFHYASEEKRLRILIAERPEGMTGYLILLRQDLPQTGWHRYRIADLQTLESDAELVRSLLAAALQYAREQNADLLEAVGLGVFPRKILEDLRPPRRRMTVWPSWYHPVREVTGLNFASPEVWDYSLFDGDAAIWPGSVEQ
jgi:hypothetical protein